MEECKKMTKYKSKETKKSLNLEYPCVCVDGNGYVLMSKLSEKGRRFKNRRRFSKRGILGDFFFKIRFIFSQRGHDVHG